MKRILYSLFCGVFALSASISAIAQSSADIDAEELIRRIETQYWGESSHSVMRMTIVTDVWSRELKMESWSIGRDRFLARILEPRKEAGTATLRIEDDMWNYLPKIDRLMKIPSSLMGDSWMGSHLTNDDLVKENKIDQLYTFDVKASGDSTAVITCTPKPDAAIVWGKLVYHADIEKMIPRNIEYYDEDGELVRTILFDNVKKISGHWVPLQMVVQPKDKPDERTELNYDELEFGVDIGNDFFSLRTLRSR